MGEITRALLMKMCAEATIEAVDNLLQTSQLLGGLAKAVMEEQEAADLVNPEQLIEASARCIDTIELIVEAARPPEHELSDWEQTNLHHELVQVRNQLQRMRNQLLNIPNDVKEDSGRSDIQQDA